jgi:hypothetical protein
MSRPAIFLNSSADKCGALPVPGDAIVILPGLLFTWAMNSCTVFAGEELGTNM